jgi:hypothetical protein
VLPPSGLLLIAVLANAPVQSAFQTLPSSNGQTAIVVDVLTGKLTHFRDQLFATEEPLLDAAGKEVWVGNQPQAVKSRDLLYDAYLGLRSDGAQRWLTTVPTIVDRRGYAPWKTGVRGGTGVVWWTQKVGTLEIETFAFAPRDLPRAGFVIAARVRNVGSAPANDVQLFSLHNFHLGFGRPGVMADLAENGETVEAPGATDVLERAFAGVVVARPLGPLKRRSAWLGTAPAASNGYQLVAAGAPADLPPLTGTTAVADGWASGFQFELGTLAAGAQAWAATVIAYDADPFGGSKAQAALDALTQGKSAQTLVEAELAGWAQLQQGLQVPAGLIGDQEDVLRQSAVVLEMAQVKSKSAFLREVLSRDGEPRRTRIPGVTLPAEVPHHGYGAMLASLPPGEWTVAWARDGAYATVALAALGRNATARDGLLYFLDAEAGRFQQWAELAPYAMLPYQVTLTRYHGFGVEETDFNDFGPNLEFDGFGLVLWALREYERRSHDLTLVDARWEAIATRIADPLVALIDPTTGLVRKDSSIWETHWKGRERSWTFTNLTAVRGLCDAAALADRKGDAARATRYREAGTRLRSAIATHLVDLSGALASNAEELARGNGHHDAAVLEAIAMGIFNPAGRIAQRTFDALDENLRAPGGSGWSRNDDRTDHPNESDLSPWGSEYDSAEWVVTDLRGALAGRRTGKLDRADQLLGWVTAQAAANYLLIPETFDEKTGAWKFNAPMVGFGAGAYALALADRDLADPACGSYFSEPGLIEEPPDAGPDPMTVGPKSPGTTAPMRHPCGCSEGPGVAVLLVPGALWLRRKRARNASVPRPSNQTF